MVALIVNISLFDHNITLTYDWPARMWHTKGVSCIFNFKNLISSVNEAGFFCVIDKVAK